MVKMSKWCNHENFVPNNSTCLKTVNVNKTPYQLVWHDLTLSPLKYIVLWLHHLTFSGAFSLTFG